MNAQKPAKPATAKPPATAQKNPAPPKPPVPQKPSAQKKSQAPQRHQRFLLVDFENIQSEDLSLLMSDIHIIVFMGHNQNRLPLDIVMKYQKLGSRLEWKKIDGIGGNALDFVIAYYMGRVFDKDAAAQCIVLSKDKGFDPLIKMLVAEGKSCRRIESIAGLK